LTFLRLRLRGALHKLKCQGKISHAKAQRRKALPRFLGFSLRLCAFAWETFFDSDTCQDLTTFCLKRLRGVNFCASLFSFD
jgi:hypothetical protein